LFPHSRLYFAVFPQHSTQISSDLLVAVAYLGITNIDKVCYSGHHSNQEIFHMNVSLTPELDKFVADKVASGRYASASEVVREALRLLEEQEKSRAVRLEEFNRELQARIDALDRGERVTAEEAREHFRRRSIERRKQIA
jgi:antitoxin ParD1/3/4